MNANYLSRATQIILLALSLGLGSEGYAQTSWEGRVAGVEAPRMPSLRLGERQSISIAFDVLGSEHNELVYRLSHRNADGSPSSLLPSEALSRIGEYDIHEMERSFGTDMPYTHYRLELPNREVEPRVSGRYLLEVARRGDWEQPLLSMPIYVYEGGVTAEMEVNHQMLRQEPEKRQALSFALTTAPSLTINNAQELRVEVYQNTSRLAPPVLLSPAAESYRGQWLWRNDLAATFWAGSEYLYLEHTHRDGIGEGIAELSTREGLSELLLPTTDYSQRASYQYRQDYNGAQRLGKSEIGDYRTEGEYHLVTFTLSGEAKGQTIYLEGQAFDHLSLEERSLVYDEASQLYSLTLPLKNGYQEYRYVRLSGDGEPLGGSFYQTSNSYQALVYYRPMGGRYDRLLGIFACNTP